MLDWIDIEGVRNLAHQTVRLAGMVVVAGSNAQGKTSFLEAAYLLATTRSFRTREPREAIAHEASALRLRGCLRRPDGSLLELGMALGRARGERALVVGQSDAKLSEYIGLLPTLALAGDSLRSLAGSPAERRRFIDRATAAADPEHLSDLSEYRRALVQRNELLRTGAPDGLLEPWERVLGRAGDRLARRRRRQVQAWQREMGAWPGLYPEGEMTTLRYWEAGQRRSPGSGESHGGDTRMDLAGRLASCRARDRQLARTTIGPHRDDLEIEVGGVDLLCYGSAGQVRSAVSALALAQARAVRAARGGMAPLLIWDDVDTDLDAARLAALLRAAASEGQVLAASSKPGLAPPPEALRLFAVNGSLVPDGHGGGTPAAGA